MSFNEWIENLKNEKPELKPFLEKISVFFNDEGFNAATFEKKVNIGLQKIDGEVDEFLKPE